MIDGVEGFEPELNLLLLVDGKIRLTAMSTLKVPGERYGNNPLKRTRATFLGHSNPYVFLAGKANNHIRCADSDYALKSGRK